MGQTDEKGRPMTYWGGKQNKQQTAVDWYTDELLGLMLELATATISESEYHIKRRKAKEQAKQMEKEQIMKAASVVLWNNSANSKEVAEQYYNETYNK